MFTLHVFTNIGPMLTHILPILMHANGVNIAAACNDATNPTGVFADLKKVADSIQGGLKNVGIAIFVIGIIVAGMMRMLAFGSDRRVMFSNMALTGSCVGLAIVLLASAIETFLCTQINSTGFLGGLF
jgi:type IV secretory pathway VirB2 component (pilin)